VVVDAPDKDTLNSSTKAVPGKVVVVVVLVLVVLVVVVLVLVVLVVVVLVLVVLVVVVKLVVVVTVVVVVVVEVVVTISLHDRSKKFVEVSVSSVSIKKVTFASGKGGAAGGVKFASHLATPLVILIPSIHPS